MAIIDGNDSPMDLWRDNMTFPTIFLYTIVTLTGIAVTVYLSHMVTLIIEKLSGSNHHIAAAAVLIVWCSIIIAGMFWLFMK